MGTPTVYVAITLGLLLAGVMLLVFAKKAAPPKPSTDDRARASYLRAVPTTPGKKPRYADDSDGLDEHTRYQMNVIEARCIAMADDITNEYIEVMQQQGLTKEQMVAQLETEQFGEYLNGRVREFKLKCYLEQGYIQP